MAQITHVVDDDGHMTYNEAVETLRARARADCEYDEAVKREFAALSLNPLRVTLVCPDGCDALMAMRKPYVALVSRDGLPGREYLFCADSLPDLVAALPEKRQGPNGPVDSAQLIRPTNDWL